MNGKEEPGKFKPTFENRGFWEYYKDLERQFEEFLEYVPYLEGNNNTYSFRLASLILSIGAHIDSAFKEVAKYQEFSQRYPRLRKRAEKGTTRIGDYLPLAESYRLSEREVEFKCLPNRIRVTPFKNFLRKKDRVSTPYWWTVYNKVKHQFSDNFKKATLQTTKDALAGAFLLNVIHTPSALKLCEFGLVKNRLGRGDLEPYIFEKILKKKQAYPCYIETPLFVYDYEQIVGVKP